MTGGEFAVGVIAKVQETEFPAGSVALSPIDEYEFDVVINILL